MADMQELEYRITRLETELLKTNDRHNALLKFITESQQEAADGGAPDGTTSDPEPEENPND